MRVAMAFLLTERPGQLGWRAWDCMGEESILGRMGSPTRWSGSWRARWAREAGDVTPTYIWALDWPKAMRRSICRHHRFVGGVAVGGEGFRPIPAETVSRCS